MQKRVARQLPRDRDRLASSKRDIVEQMGVDPTRIDRRADRRRPHGFPAPPAGSPVPGRIMSPRRADVPFKGLLPLVEAVAKLRTERDTSSWSWSAGPDPGARWPRPSSASGCATWCASRAAITDDALVESLRRGPRGGRAVAVRGVLAAGGRGHGLRGAGGGDDRGRVARGGGGRRRDGVAGAPRRSRSAWPKPSAGCSTLRICGRGSARPGASGCCTASLGRSRARGTAELRWTTSCWRLGRRRPPHADRRLRPVGRPTGRSAPRPRLRCRAARLRGGARGRGGDRARCRADEVAQVRGTFGAMVDTGELDPAVNRFGAVQGDALAPALRRRHLRPDHRCRRCSSTFPTTRRP